MATATKQEVLMRVWGRGTALVSMDLEGSMGKKSLKTDDKTEKKANCLKQLS